MHAPAGRAIHWMLLVVVAATLGCRGSNPFGRYVQVTKTSDPELAEIEAPEQRLATTKPRLTGEQLTGSDTRSESSDQTIRATAVSSRQPADRTTTAAARSQASGGDASRGIDTLATTSRVAGPNSDREIPSDELLEILQEFPPELREQALRQFVAAATRSADQTTQPNAVLSELAKRLKDLPALPEPSSSPPSVLPTRIASDANASAAAVASLSDSAGSPQSAPAAGASASISDANISNANITDADGGQLEAVEVQTISGSVDADKSEVMTASATQNPAEALMVSRAVADELSDKIAEGDAGTPRSDAADAEAKQLSETELLTRLVERLSSDDADESEAERTSRLIKLRHLMVLAGDPDSAVEGIEGMAEAEQEYLRHHLLGLWTMIDPQGHPVPSRRFTTAIPQIRQAAKFAAAATDSLEVRSLAFCTEIESYGQITPFPGNRFEPGQQVILYCEIENFTANKVEDGYATHLQGSYDVYSEKKEKVFSQVLPADQQVSANYLRDYFIAYQMFLPSGLAPGTYRLQLTMEDANAKKYGQASIPFEIAE